MTGGNVSFYNESSGRPIHPTPIVGVLGLLEDATTAVPLRLPRPGLDVWLLGRRVELGGSVRSARPRPPRGPTLDLPAEAAPPPPARPPAPPGRRPRPLRRRPRPRPGRSHPGRRGRRHRRAPEIRPHGRGRRAGRPQDLEPAQVPLAALVSESASRVLLAAPPEAADQLRSLARTADAPPPAWAPPAATAWSFPDSSTSPCRSSATPMGALPALLGAPDRADSLTRAGSPAHPLLPEVPHRSQRRRVVPARPNQKGRGPRRRVGMQPSRPEAGAQRNLGGPCDSGEGRRLAGGPHGWVAAGRRGRGGAAGGGGGGSGGGGRGQEQQPRMANTELVGHVAPPQRGGYGDVWAHRDVAYLGNLRQADCRPANGVWAISLKDPAKPRPLASFAKFPGSDGEDVWVGAVRTKAFTGDLAAVGIQRCSRQTRGSPGWRCTT